MEILGPLSTLLSLNSQDVATELLHARATALSFIKLLGRAVEVLLTFVVLIAVVYLMRIVLSPRQGITDPDDYWPLTMKHWSDRLPNLSKAVRILRYSSRRLKV